jgi:hypothetical protein
MPHARVPFIPLLSRLCWSPAEYAALTGFSISFIYEKIKDGTLPSEKINGRRIINHCGGKEFIGLGREHISPIDEIPAELAGPTSALEPPPPSWRRDDLRRPTPTGPRSRISPHSRGTARRQRATAVAVPSATAVIEEKATTAIKDS